MGEFPHQAETAHTKRIVDFIVSSTLERVPENGLRVAREAILDCVGVAVAGSIEPVGEITAEWARESAGNGRSTIWGHAFRAAPHDAALVNGTAAHALDFDDVTWGLIGHPSVSLTGALFALAEARGKSGRDLLLAYATGFEVMAKIGRTTQPAHSLENGWHATISIGTFGATAACCKLLGLDAEQTAHALGIAYSMTSGNTSNFGTMTKPLHAGLAARNGVEAALLAQKGLTSVPHPFDGPRSFHAVYSRGLPARMEALEELGKEYELDVRGVVIKPYPCCVSAHTSIDAALRLYREDKVRPDDVRAIDIRATRYTYDKLSYHLPSTGLEAKFSANYTVARAITDGKLTLGTFTDEAVNDPKVRELVKRVSIRVDDDIDRAWKIGSRPVKMEATLADGRTIEKTVDISKGNPEVPLTREELETKFMDCATLVLSQRAASRALEMLMHLEDVASIAEVNRLLAGDKVAGGVRIPAE
ncbi:MAG: MmgE/PrpD family protein [Rhizobiaceae bacterium]|nr:MmgE/PrpD family protein [Rhizobiaceae bacterium]